MKKLSEYKNEEALDLLADIVEPVAYIFADEAFAQKFQENKLSAIRHAIKYHKKEVLSILAALDGVPVKDYECNLFTVPMVLMEIMNDTDLLDFFASQGLKIGEESSGSAMENTEEELSEDSSDM